MEKSVIEVFGYYGEMSTFNGVRYLIPVSLGYYSDYTKVEEVIRKSSVLPELEDGKFILFISDDTL